MRGFLFASRTQVNGLRHRTLEYSGSRCFEGVECPFVFSSSAEIPVFCPREQCPLHVFSLEVVSPERLPAGPSIAWRFSGNSTKVTVFPKNTWTDTPLSSFPLPFVCPYLLSSCFIYLFIFLSFFHNGNSYFSLVFE